MQKDFVLRSAIASKPARSGNVFLSFSQKSLLHPLQAVTQSWFNHGKFLISDFGGVLLHVSLGNAAGLVLCLCSHSQPLSFSALYSQQQYSKPLTTFLEDHKVYFCDLIVPWQEVALATGVLAGLLVLLKSISQLNDAASVSWPEMRCLRVISWERLRFRFCSDPSSPGWPRIWRKSEILVLARHPR